jgi:transcriptional regulator with XRE-family HTH domain
LKVPELRVPEKVGDLGSYLKEQRESARLSLRQLASVAGVSTPYLSQSERGLRKPSAEVLQQIAKGLQISAEALFQRAGLLEHAGGADVEAAIHSDVRLTGRQKRVLLDIYATFRAENSRTEDKEAAAQAAQEQDQAAAAAVAGAAVLADDDLADGDQGISGRAPVVSLVPDTDIDTDSPAMARAAKPRKTARKRATKRAATKAATKKAAGEG